MVFVFTSDQICSDKYLAIGSMAENISHEFGVYSNVFGVYLRVQQFSQAMPVTIGCTTPNVQQILHSA